jgi:drug/metabolite transporter (DMT)-like permease
MVPKIDVKVFLAFAAIYVIWGTTYLAIRIGLESIEPFILASMRYLIAGCLLLFFCRVKGEAIFSRSAINNIILGAFMLTLGQGVLFWAEKYISSGLTAVFGSTLPVCYIIADRKQWKSNFSSKLTLVSIVLGITGIVILFSNQTGGGDPHTAEMKLVASAAAVASCLCWAAGSLYYKYNHTSGSLYANVGWQLIGGTIACLLVSAATGELGSFSMSAVTLSSWAAVVYLAVAGSIIAFTASYWLLARRPAPVVGTYAYVNPVIAVLLGYLAMNETITISQVAGMMIILVAAYLANRVKFQHSEA